ncbi:YPDG domain-containing protein [Corynebacterium sp. 21KM1197]|uniref:YPDG domain-containing protein n=1 Tax=Corynebacterium sp. 21KM1197 TaxID=2989734 RepID=UPI0029CA8A6B|nr:YPDG domain-containing protein [Corynebacterium sp. 21KM1197]WPF68660.1 YPDG domain-containing protein [Corynebacterium sp. 21KM1197]
MRKRVSAAAISLALAGSAFATPLAFADDQTDVEVLEVTQGEGAEEATQEVAEVTPEAVEAVEATEDAPKVTTYAADDTLSYGTDNKVEIPWNTEQEFEIQGTVAPNARFIAPDQKIEGWEYKVDEKTGKLTIKAEESRRPGSTLSLPILVSTTTNYSQINIVATVVKGDTSQSDDVTLTYPTEATEIAPGESATITPTVEGTIPSGTKFVMNEKNKDNWTFQVDDKGAVTATLPADAKVGRNWNMGLVVVFPDGTTQEHKVPVKAVAAEDSPSKQLELSYEDIEVPFGGEVTKDLTVQGGNLDGATFELVHESYAGMDFAIDSSTGALTVKSGEAKRGTGVWVPIKVTYSDSSVNYVVFHATIGAPENPMADAAENAPAYEDVEVAAGESVEVKQSGSVPEGTRYIAPTTEGTDWTVAVAEDGTATVTAPAGTVKGSKLFIPVIVKYADGSTESVRFTATVK